MFFRFIILFLLLSSSFNVATAQNINMFKSGSYSQLLQQRENQPFLLVLWSLDCPPCYKELQMLGNEIKKQPEMSLVIVSTDSADDIDELNQKLAQFGLNNVEAWVFDNQMAQKLRYEIDPGWFGELPRSYLFDAEHNRHSISGVLKPEVLNYLERI